MSLAEVMEQHPQLTADGIGVVPLPEKRSHMHALRLVDGRTDLARRETRIAEVAAWLREDFAPIRTPSQAGYTLKQLAEQTHLGPYISNGEPIAAAFVAGCPYRQGDDVNVTFGASASFDGSVQRRQVAN